MKLTETKLTDLYKRLVAFVDYGVNENGTIVNVRSDEQKAVEVLDLPLHLPYRELLARSSADKIFFHPLNEDLMSGESDVVRKFRIRMNILLNVKFTTLMQNLLAMVANPETHKKMCVEGKSELLPMMDNVKPELVRDFSVRLCAKRISESPTDSIINIHLTRNGTKNGKKFNKMGVVRFPMYKELKEGALDNVIKAKRDRDIIIALHEYIFPGLVDGVYSFGSESHVAPWFESLYFSGLNLAARFNKLLELYGNLLTEADLEPFDISWARELTNVKDLVPLIRDIPVQRGNQGIENLAEKLRSETRVDVPKHAPVENVKEPEPEQPRYVEPKVSQESRYVELTPDSQQARMVTQNPPAVSQPQAQVQTNASGKVSMGQLRQTNQYLNYVPTGIDKMVRTEQMEKIKQVQANIAGYKQMVDRVTNQVVNVPVDAYGNVIEMPQMPYPSYPQYPQQATTPFAGLQPPPNPAMMQQQPPMPFANLNPQPNPYPQQAQMQYPPQPVYQNQPVVINQAPYPQQAQYPQQGNYPQLNPWFVR